MAWTLSQIPTCVPSEGAAQTELCPSGYSLSLVQAYLPAHNPELPTPADFQVGLWAFALVITVYLLSTGIGVVIRLFRGQD